jgi:hypothetical protein
MAMNYIGIFEDNDRRMITIRRVDDPQMPFRIRITLPEQIKRALRQHPDYPFEITDELKGCICRDDKAGEYLKVEAGALRANGIGPTLNLFPLENGDIEPQVSMGLYNDWEDDLGLPWAYPLSKYRRQSPLSSV